MGTRRHPQDAAGPSVSGRDAKAERLRRFLGPVAMRDAETVERWRGASAAEHATAMIELSEFAAQMVQQTGHGKDPSEMFPGFPRLARVGEGRGW